MFLIHSDSVQKMLTALFIWLNLEYSENYMDKYQGKMFLNIENVLVSQCTALLLFLEVSEVKMSYFHWPTTWEM